MPDYKVPKPKKEKDLPTTGPYSYELQVRMPVNAAILKGLSVGVEAEVKMIGKVVEIEMRESESGRGRNELTILPTTISVYPENEFSKLAKDDGED